MRSGYLAIRGSHMPPPPGTRVGPTAADERATVAILVRREHSLDISKLRRVLTHGALAARHGAAADDITRVRAFAAAHHLTVESVDRARRMVRLSGGVQELAAAFDTTVETYHHAGTTFRAQLDQIHVPADLEPIVMGVFGLDTRPIAQPLFRAGSLASPGTFPVGDIARLYNFPTAFDGSGQTVAILEFGGGFVQADLDAYFTKLGRPTPSVTAISIDGATNKPTGDVASADAEVMLDTEIVGVVAPGAAIAVYFAPNTLLGWIDALSAAISDGACAVSISWGNAEKYWPTAGMDAVDGLFQDAAALGVTICAATGDNGSTNAVDDKRQHVQFPSTSPHVLACGGTSLVAAIDGGIATETVWNNDRGATGGGVSDYFSRPAYQATATVPLSLNPGQFAGRGVPDVAGDADPRTGYQVRIDGNDYVYGGTSAVSPLWAGLVALFSQYLGPGGIGFFNAVLYEDRSLQASLHDITSGSNGAFSAGDGWDACTGWGTPDGTRLLQILATWAFARVQPPFDG
jgi:kumamolisin